MHRDPVTSTAVRSVGYDPATHTLEVEFAGGIYDYHGVPAALYRQLRAAGSKGRFVNYRIKDAFPFTGPRKKRRPKKTKPRQ